MRFVNKIVSTVKGNPFLRHGVPFIILMVGGSFYMKQFASLRYEFSRKESKEAKDLQNELRKLNMGVKPASLESEYEKIKQIDLNKWENKRISRPWEEEDSENK